MRKIKLCWFMLFVGLAIMALFLVAMPALAISNPDSISFGAGTSPTYNVFENVHEIGDMLFVAEGYVHYVTEPTDYTASHAFLTEYFYILMKIK